MKIEYRTKEELNNTSFNPRTRKKYINSINVTRVIYFLCFLVFTFLSVLFCTFMLKIKTILLIVLFIGSMVMTILFLFLFITVFLTKDLYILISKDGLMYRKKINHQFRIYNYQYFEKQKFYGSMQTTFYLKRKFTIYYIFLFDKEKELPSGFEAFSFLPLEQVLYALPDAHGKEGFIYYDETNKVKSLRIFK